MSAKVSVNKLILTALCLLPMPYAVAAATVTTDVSTAPGAGAVVQTVSISGTIAAIDTETRVVTLTLADGQQSSITAGPEVRNFAQLQVGNVVDMELTRALALELKKDSSAAVGRTDEAAAASAAPGSMPAGIVGTRTQVMAEVTAINQETQSVTLRGPNRTVDLAIQNPKQFEAIAIGDRVLATYVESMAVKVTPATPTE